MKRKILKYKVGGHAQAISLHPSSFSPVPGVLNSSLLHIARYSLWRVLTAYPRESRAMQNFDNILNDHGKGMSVMYSITAKEGYKQIFP